MVGVLANQAMNYFISGEVPKRIGNAHPNIVPYQAFAVADGHLMVAAGNDAQYAKFCGVLGRPELAKAFDYATNAQRVAHRATLVPILREAVSTWARDELLAQLATAGVPAGPINSVEDVFRHPQVLARGMRVDIPTPGIAGAAVPGLRSPLRLSASPLQLGRPAPRLGEHTEAVRRELGLEVGGR
jgi:crotonobetainyl-CoA:carnitine CoA-transferase CaiB-like acyl-CoA transferase